MRWWALSLCIACTGAPAKSGPDAGMPTAPAASAGAPSARPPHQLPNDAVPSRASPAPDGPSVKALTGAVPGLVAGARISPGGSIALARGDELTLDFPHGARVLLVGPGQGQVAEGEREGLLWKEGAASVDLPPGAVTAGSGFWLATPSGRIDIVRGGRLAMRSFASGELQAIMVSGSASFTRGTGAATSRVQALLSPGELLWAGPGDVERTKGPGLTLEKALAKVLTSRPRDKHAIDVAALDAALALQLEEVKTEVTREHALVLAHRQSLHAADAGTMALQAALSSHAALLASSKTRLHILLDQRAAARLGLAHAQPDLLGDEVRALLGRAP